MNISTLSTPHDSQRWYHRDASGLCSEVTSKGDGSLRRPTLRDARELGLLPGVTGICKIYPGALNWWSDDIRIAGEVGTRRHQLIEDWHLGLPSAYLPDGEDYKFCKPYMDWHSANVSVTKSAETVITSLDHGYAGTMDLHCGLSDNRTAVVDLKNRKNLGTYDTDAMQLAAYRRAIGADVGISVILGTAQPEILVKEWSPDEDAQAWYRFELCLALFKSANNYRPEHWHNGQERDGRKEI